VRLGVLTLGLLGGCVEYDVITHSFDDFFVQENNIVLSDILFVIDDSASMTEEQVRLQANFASLLDTIVEAEADFQIGIVTTDTTSDQAGLLRGGAITADDPQIENKLKIALEVGTDGDRDEQGLRAMQMAVDGRNAGFPRDNAMRSVILVSDEDDESSGEVASFILSLATAAEGSQYGLHGIVGDLPNGCATGTSAAAPGARYIEAIETLNGHRESICADDYSAVLERVGLDVAGLPDTFVLTQIPGVDSIDVFVDEVEIPQRDRDGWIYDPAENAVVFTGRAIPRPGMLIGVNYQPMVSQN